MNTISLAIIEDDVLIQESLEDFFSAQTNIECLQIASSVEQYLKDFDALIKVPNIILLDINLLGMSGIDGIPLLLNELPKTNIIMLTTFEDNDSIYKALCAGACSYLSKKTSLKKILEAVEIVNNGGSYMSPSIARKIVNRFTPKHNQSNLLTPRQKEIVTGIVDGKSYKMIANDLFVSIDTVRTHIKNIYKALEIHSKAELIRKSFDNKL
ncbi:response regulator transcription factor [Bizionia gelidisalsuginis]|uniref:Response regulator transcription factor n=1 Tax=Bizionia gelidisalsuginis TaxID=291188 RepID=A0ABY3M766_9FLAO|nr:response regulator transcription factor [Bizionia gelidisalsuginis]TYC08485.1 response regulator transcription factor [Bizionia gelidisalsuginis]